MQFRLCTKDQFHYYEKNSQKSISKRTTIPERTKPNQTNKKTKTQKPETV